MPPKPAHKPEDSDYDSASDEDFKPDAQPQDEELSSSSSSSDDEAVPTTIAKPARRPARKGAKRVAGADEAEWDSGDEATVKKKRRNGDALSEDEGGNGGFVRTRAQRRGETMEMRRALVSTKGSTLDVESVWERLRAMPVGRSAREEEEKEERNEDYIVIKRSTRFAGQVTTEERRVLRDSMEAKIYLEELEKGKKQHKDDAITSATDPSQKEDPQAQQQEDGSQPALPLRRPLRRPLKFDPNPLGEVRGLPPHLQLRFPRSKAAHLPAVPVAPGIENKRALPKLTETAKLNTVQKSKYDWAGFVDKSDLAEELDEYGKSKESYLGRREFLGRAEGRREEGRLRGR